MQVADLTFEVRNASLQRVAILQPGDGLTTFKATLRFNNVGTWEITIPETSARADLLRTPGYGIIVTGPGGVLFSGPTTAATNQKTSGSPIGVWAIRGATDNIVLGEHLAYPTPASAVVTAQTSAYDAYTAVASTVMYYYVKRNMVASANGGSAPAARAVTGLTVATDTSIGSSIVGKARFDNLGTLMQSIAAISSPNLGFDVKQSSTNIQFSVYQPSDRTGTIRLDVANNTLQKASYGYGYGPNHVVVAGQGQGADRVFVETANSTSESYWSRRVERFVDQRNETDTTKLTQAGTDLLTQEGGTITSLDIVPTNDSTMTYGVDFNLGDKVTVTVGAQEITGIVTTAQFDVKTDGLWVGLTVGNATGFDYEAVMMKRQTDTSARVAALEKSEALSGVIPVSAGGTGAQTLTGYVYGNGTSTMTAATTIPFSSITGTVPFSSVTGTVPASQGGTGTGVTTGAGLVPVIPSGSTPFVTVGGSASMSSAGVITFAGVTTISVNNAFSSSYTNYRVIFEAYGSAGSGDNSSLSFRFRVSGTDKAVDGYYQGNTYIVSNSGSVNVSNLNFGAQISLANIRNSDSVVGNLQVFDLIKPAVTAPSGLTGFGQGWSTQPTFYYLNGQLRNSLAYDGFSIISSSTPIYGSLTIYGYR